jgi:hypothetical protein
MSLMSHVYPYNKRTMLNVLYDTIDVLGLTLEHTNSERGTLLVSTKDKQPKTVRIAISSEHPDQSTRVQFFSDSDDSDSWTKTLSKVFFDEVDATINSSLLGGIGKTLHDNQV